MHFLLPSLSKKKRHRTKRERAVIATKKLPEFFFIHKKEQNRLRAISLQGYMIKDISGDFDSTENSRILGGLIHIISANC